MWRKIWAGIAGYIVWWVIGTVGFVGLRVLWHDYAVAEPTTNFTLSMQLARLAVGLACSIDAGIIISLITQRRTIVPWVVGIVLVLQFLPVHYHLWTKFPLWYHAFFLITLAPAVVLGSRWALRWKSKHFVSNEEGNVAV
jgi:hypothetical protein